MKLYLETDPKSQIEFVNRNKEAVTARKGKLLEIHVFRSEETANDYAQQAIERGRRAKVFRRNFSADGIEFILYAVVIRAGK